MSMFKKLGDAEEDVYRKHLDHADQTAPAPTQKAAVNFLTVPRVCVEEARRHIEIAARDQNATSKQRHDALQLLGKLRKLLDTA